MFLLLEEFKKEKARESNVPGFVIFTNKTLSELALKKPTALSELSGIKGMSSSKIQKYGQAVIDIIKDYLND